MKRRREVPIIMSVVEFVIKTKPVALSLIPTGHSWTCSTLEPNGLIERAQFFYPRSKSFASQIYAKAVLSQFTIQNERMPASAFEFVMAIAVSSLNDKADKDGNLPEEIERRDLSDAMDMCGCYLDLIRDHAHDIKKLETQLEKERCKSK
jgi:hypothetical protein